MRIRALAADYDGTLAHDGQVTPDTWAAIAELRAAGRLALLVTGRRLDDLEQVAGDLTAFDLVVAENGALLYEPRTRDTTVLGEAPPPALIAALAEAGVPFEVGAGIVATTVPHDVALLAAIREHGLGWQIIYNKGSVMALPPGVTKATGLTAALNELGLSPHNVAGIGDAENDHAFLSLCEVAGAVGNALPAIKERADIVLRRRHGSGVAEFIRRHVLTDFAESPHIFAKYTVELGRRRAGAPLRQPVYDSNTLIVGSSGSGKSTLTGVLVEGLTEQGYQVCIIDPEGDHGALEPLITLGSATAAPTVEEIEGALDRAPAGVVINLVALNPASKIRLAATLLATVLASRAANGRPHWIIVDEAHHLLPAEKTPGVQALPARADGLCFVTTQPDLLNADALTHVTDLYVIGAGADEQVRRFAAAAGHAGVAPALRQTDLLTGEGLHVSVRADGLGPPRRFRVLPRRTEHRRHVRKYAGGDLGDSSFYFRGPEGRLNLRAFNVTAFAEMARGVDLPTWAHHFDNGDIARWFTEKVKDPELAAKLRDLAQDDGNDPAHTRARALALIEGQYTAGA